MEWFTNFHHFSPLDESLFGVSSPPPSPSPHPNPPPLPMEMPMAKLHEWTHEENKIFENAIAEIDTDSPAFFENIVSKVPWISTEEVKARYEALMHEMEMIVSGNFPVPNHPTVEAERMPTSTNIKGIENVEQDMGSASNSSEPKTKKTERGRHRGVPWTKDEHHCFLMGLNKFGKGDWLNISRKYVISKTPNQVASHAQKYYRRQNSSTHRRPSIHDINTVNSTTTTANFTSAITSFPTLHHSYGVGAQVLRQNPSLGPAANASNNDNSFFFPPQLSVTNTGDTSDDWDPDVFFQIISKLTIK